MSKVLPIAVADAPATVARPSAPIVLGIEPATVTQASAPAVLGIEPRKFVTLVRSWGVRHARLGRLYVVKLSDFLLAFETRAACAPANDERLTVEDVLAEIAAPPRRRARSSGASR